MTEIALLPFLVEGRQPHAARPCFHGLADAIAEVGREPAALDVEDFVPAAGAMEPESDRAVLERREGVLELVPVVEDRCCGKRRLEVEVGEAADPAEGVRDLLRLGVELRLVREVLEAAASAGGVVRAWSLDARRAWLDDLERDRLRVAPLDLRDPRPHEISREPPPDEDDEPVQPRDARPTVGERVDAKFELLLLPDGCSHAREPSLDPNRELMS